MRDFARNLAIWSLWAALWVAAVLAFGRLGASTPP